MRNNRFEIKDDDRGRYQRGHYDIVVLNPDFIKEHSYKVIKAQNYELYKEAALSQIDRYKPIVLYGIEFMFRRDPLRFSRGENKKKAIEMFVAKIEQDVDKLLASKNFPKDKKGFMGQVKMLTFVKGTPEDICELLGKKLSDRNEIILCFGD